MKRFHARNEVVKALTAEGLFVETKDNPMQIPICSKSGDIIEPILKPQWWVNCKPLAEEAIKVLLFLALDFTSCISVAYPQRRTRDKSKTIGSGLVPVVREHPRLVYLTSALVGTPLSCIFRSNRRLG